MFVQLEELKEELRRSNAIITENTVEQKCNATEQKRLNEEALSLTKRLYKTLQEIEDLHRENESLKTSQRMP